MKLLSAIYKNFLQQNLINAQGYSTLVCPLVSTMSCRLFSKQNSSFLHWKQRCIHYYYHIIIIKNVTFRHFQMKWPYSDMVYTDWKTIPGASKLKAASPSSSLDGLSYMAAGAPSSSAREGSSRKSRSLFTGSSAVSVSGGSCCGTFTMSEKYDKPSIHCIWVLRF